MSTEAVVEPIDIQLQAYNARDVDLFMTAYSKNCAITGLPGTPLLEGYSEIRERYQRLFDCSPQLKAEVSRRLVLGEWVVDHETVSGAGFEGIGEAIVAYQVKQGLIVNVFLMK